MMALTRAFSAISRLANAHAWVIRDAVWLGMALVAALFLTGVARLVAWGLLNG